MILKLYNPYIDIEVSVDEGEYYYRNELQRVYDKEIDFIILNNSATNKPIAIRPSNWAMIEVKE